MSCLDAFTGQQTRLVVVVDALDSCEQEKVLALLNAVHALCSDAKSPFILLLAIDPHIISKVRALPVVLLPLLFLLFCLFVYLLEFFFENYIKDDEFYHEKIPIILQCLISKGYSYRYKDPCFLFMQY